ncbi:efflux transporter outer membrane subunit [Sphingomicrobium flavum]|uniref:efflux transporter outer membrane subunit n=1 Tax=Sphingomicrobium flavum TaxID=1229164 RepID=UPI0021AD9CFF|nr:efflux transporter outer membrane subunit [Sphingomicrobium flavum]
MTRTLLLSGCTLLLSACAAGPGIAPSASDVLLPSAISAAPAAAPADAAAIAALLPDDPAFVALADAAMEGSPSLGAALARIDAARASAARSRAERAPNIGYDAGVAATRTSPNQFGDDLPFTPDTERVAYSANLSARWDPDLFGALRASQRAAIARLDAAGADAEAVRLALIAEIAGAVTDWRTLDNRAATLTSDLEAAEQIARLARTREDAGIAPGFDRFRAEGQAASSRSRLAALASERARLIGRLVTLTALPAPEIEAAFALSPAPIVLAEAPPSLPSGLLARRPDVEAAAARLAAADADLAATAARRFPQFNLSAGIGLLAFALGDLFSADAIVGNLAAGVAGPLFDFGRIEAEIDGAEAQTRIAFQQYRAAVFTALGDAESAYGLVEAADAEADAAAREAQMAERAARLADTRHRAGLENFLTVLEARRAADASGDRAAAAAGRAQRARIILWQALGGTRGR